MSGAATRIDGEPGKILKLDEDVVNRIAAGEVVQRPANAVKELMENSLDAGSTSITVTAKQGGLKLLQIQDNGHGIRREDLPIVCERFTTSKLREFGDLRTMSTFGFRGEALASITHTAKVTITSKTPSSQVAYKAKYSDGRLVAGGPGQSADPKPCAGVTGTTILAEDLFYNMDTRRRAFKSPGEQYKGILDVVTRYAIHFGDSGVSFTCKKHGLPSPDLHTPPKSSCLANIKVAFGPALSRELVELECSEAEELLDEVAAARGGGEDSEAGPQKLAFKARGLVSGANYSAKRSDFILFINDRLVESSSIKKAIEAAYKDVLPKSSHPFVYLGITMPSRHLDVNVHPTKREVHFLHQEQLLACLQKAVEEKLAGANQSRTFYSQVILPDMDFGAPETPSATPAAAAASTRKPRDAGDVSTGTEDVSPPSSADAGSGGDGVRGQNRSGPRSSLRPSPPAPRNVGLEAMAEGDDDDDGGGGGDSVDEYASGQERESVGSSPPGRESQRRQEARKSGSGEGGGRASGGGKRGRDAAGTAAAVDLDSFASSSSGGGGGRRSATPRGAGGRESSPSSSISSRSKKKKKHGDDHGGGAGAAAAAAPAPALAPQKLVRTDRTAGSLDAFLRPSQQPALFSSFEIASSQSQPSDGGGGSTKSKGGKRSGKTREGSGGGGSSSGGGRGSGSSSAGEEDEEGGLREGGRARKRGRANARFELGDGDAAAKDAPVALEILSSSEEESVGGVGGEDEYDGAVMCVCPEGQPSDEYTEGDGDEDGHEDGREDREGEAGGKGGNEQGAGEQDRATLVDGTKGGEERRQQPSGGGGGTGDGLIGSSGGGPEEGAGDGSTEEGDREQGQAAKASTAKGTTRKKKREASGQTGPSKPFAGLARLGGSNKSCDCCGGKRPRGPGGSIVLTEEAGAAASSSSGSHPRGDGVDGVPYPGTPSSDGHNQAAAAVRAQQQHKRPDSFVETGIKYNSVRSLISDFKIQAHKGVTQMLRKYTFVGMVDIHLSLLQFNTKLVLVNHTALSKEAFFQMTLRRFGVMPRLPLATPLPLLPLIRAALELPEAAWTQTDGDKDELAEDAVKLLEEKSPLLEEYFMINLSRRDGVTVGDGKDGCDAAGAATAAAAAAAEEADRAQAPQALCISSLPLLLEGHTPVGEGLPMFLLRLATEVDWSEERTCFEGVATELALFYSTLPQGGEETAVSPASLPSPPPPPPRSPLPPSTPATPSFPQTPAQPAAAGTQKEGVGSTRKGPAAGAGAGAAGAGRRGEFALAPSEATAVVQHILYPAFRWALMPPQAFAVDGTVLQLACLERLYKVFERC